MNTHSPEEIAAVIQPQFAETEETALINIVKRYYDQDTWKADTIFEDSSFTLLQDILDQSGELEQRVDPRILITTAYSKKAAGK